MTRALLFAVLVACALAALVMLDSRQTAEGSSQLLPSVAAPVGATATPTQCIASYTCSTTAGATIVAGTTDIGNHCDDCVTNISLPFAFSLYGTSFSNANISSNGNAQFVSSGNDFNNVCLPANTLGPTIFAYWEDLDTDANGTCT